MKRLVLVIFIILCVMFFFPKTKAVGTFDGSIYRGEAIPKCFGFSKSFIIPDGTGFVCYGFFY